MSYLVVALPENTILQELQSIRNFFYQNNFRYHNKPCKDIAHITLAKISSNINNWFIEALEGSLENEKQFMLTNFYTHTQEHLWSRQSQWKEKYPDWCWWFAVLFPNNRNLVNISNNIINVARNHGIDESYDYAHNIANLSTNDISNVNSLKYLANHMNICNHIRLDRMINAKSIFLQKFKHNWILIDKIAIRDNLWTILKEIYLKV